MSRYLTCLAMAAFLKALPASGQIEAELPAFPETSPPPEISPSAKAALDLARDWIEAQAAPGTGHEGEIVFTYGETLPSVVCAPLYPCAIALEPGERIRQVDVGDSVRWRITPSVVGSPLGVETTVVTAKPTDIDLHTALFLATDRRLYTIRLVSSGSEWMPRVAFAYPDSVSAAWARYYSQQTEVLQETVLDDGLVVDDLDFGYRIEGKAEWTPIRVYADGRRTHVQFPERLTEMPAPPTLSLLTGRSGDDLELVNYRMIDDRYIVDRVIDRAVLSSSDGKTATIEKLKN